MSRYIDADALKQNLKENYTFYGFVDLLKDFYVAIDEAPTIDIVRCKECRYCHRNYVDMTPPYQHDYCYKFSRYMNADDFCSYGDKRDD